MPKSSYLIVGGGMTADAAVRGIREVDSNRSISVIGAEPDPPYDRPPLSKGLWRDKPFESVWRTRDDLGATFHLGRRAQRLDPRSRQVTDDRGEVHTYDRLLLATGATPRRLPFDAAPIIYYRTLDDYRRLRALSGERRRFAVIGSGFIGSEIAAALAMQKRDVVMIFPGDGIGARLFPADVVSSLDELYRGKGVELIAGATVTGARPVRDQVSLEVRQKRAGTVRTLTVDAVVAGIGVQPGVELAQQAGLEVDDGIQVDASLRASRPDIYAAGDVARFHNPALDRWLRVEHEDNANTMGRLAGRAMAGEAVSYDHLPMFYSDLFDLGYEAVGEVDARLEMVADWSAPYRKGVVYYLRDRRVRGVLLLNVWEQVDAARRLIAEPGPFAAADLKGRLPAS